MEANVVCALVTHIIFNTFFILKGLFLIVLGVMAIGFAETIPYLQYITSAEQTMYDSVSGIAFFLSSHFGSLALTIGIVSFFLAIAGIAVAALKAAKKGSSTHIMVLAVILFILFVLELFAVSIIGVYSSLKTKNLKLDDRELRYIEIVNMCCGINGRTDFELSNQPVPSTCRSYTSGCHPYLGKLYQEDVITVAVLGVLTFITLMVLVSSIAFLMSIRKRYS